MGLFKNQCQVCGTEYKKKENKENCEHCGSNLRDKELEKLRYYGYGNLVQDGQPIPITGMTYVTSQRIFVILDDPGKLTIETVAEPITVGGATIQTGKASLMMPVSQIASVDIEGGLASKVLNIKTKDGHEYHLQPADIKDCKKRIEAAMEG